MRWNRWTGSSNRRRAWMMVGAAALAGASLAGGCASRGDKLTETNRSLQDQNLRLQDELREARAMLADSGNANSDARGLIAQYQTQITELERKLDERDRALKEFGGRIDQFDVRLDPRTDRALADLARQYSDLMTYDSERGMLRFNSDLTFDSGSAVVRDQARQTLSRLAQILNEAAARGLVIEIVGHTDNEPMSAATRQKHFSNLHLSTHRAVAVHNVLEEMGVAPERMIAAGRGPFDPLVPHNARGGTPANRRVEIFLREDTYSSPVQLQAGVSGEGSIEVDRRPPPTRGPDVTK